MPRPATSLPATASTPLIAREEATRNVVRPTPPERRASSAIENDETAAEEQALRRLLRSYEAAYEDLNVAAAVVVWPSVDRRALARAFATLKSQGLEFESCAIAVGGERATAHCRGTLQFVRRVGHPVMLTADQQWVFTMQRVGTNWKIDEVSVRQASLMAGRTGG